jgi:hypothetical protein
MSRIIENTHRSNHSIFLPQNYGSPFNDTAERISGLGLARLDFERCSARSGARGTSFAARDCPVRFMRVAYDIALRRWA